MWYLMENVQETYILHTISLSLSLSLSIFRCFIREMTCGIWWENVQETYILHTISLSQFLDVLHVKWHMVSDGECTRNLYITYHLSLSLSIFRCFTREMTWYLMENVQETYILHTISLSQFLDVLHVKWHVVSDGECTRNLYITYHLSLSLSIFRCFTREMTCGIWWRMYKKPIYYIPSLSLSLTF